MDDSTGVDSRDTQDEGQEPERDLFGNFVEPWREEWVGMPEFIQEDLEPFKTVYVHFENKEDMEEFARLVEQPITFNTRSIWYPKAEIGRIANKRWVGEEDSEPEDQTVCADGSENLAEEDYPAYDENDEIPSEESLPTATDGVLLFD